ncbi:uncharacterized protein F4807DRAFT_27511 [Annulohypoxylon truncatum]|uniref:uncharacterized protein n=1 Tax=Annulohypoxylon truncatum TaxID=327061 RepID=UPI002008C742|nr:uncharacterized protein F4807DRAFT_27511 [Annulohypoxylon truncatum]KAI1211169.1 hypothetical protein F4807DRAFT_27511 [Annulohypoxylon truncatum]
MTIPHNYTQPQPQQTHQEQYGPVEITVTTRRITTSEDPVEFIHPAAMSRLGEAVGGLSSPLGKATENVPGGGKDDHPQEAASQASVPRSVPDTSDGNEGEGEMVPAAGRINDKGEVIDDEGTPIGRVTHAEVKNLSGLIVTTEGDILDEDGGVVGKAEPLEDVASEFNYTTKTGKDTATQGGQEGQEQEGKEGQEGEQPQRGGGSRFGGALSGISGTAQSALGGVTGGLGQTAKSATGAAGDTAKGVTDTAGEATGTKDATGEAGDAAQGITEAAGDTAEGATGAVDDAAQGATGAAEGTAKNVDVPETSDVGGDAADVAEKAAEGDVPGEQELEEGGAPIELKDEEPELGSKVGDLTKEGLAPIDIPSLSPSVANKVVALFEGPFTIADGGKVTDKQGKVIGKLANGSDIQDLVGRDVKEIDSQGNLVADSGTIVGKVDIAPEGSIAQRIKEEVPEAADRLNAIEQQAEQAEKAAPIQIPSFAPSVADKVIAMFEGPFNIAEDGQVTDQKGKVLGKLAEGQEYEHLVGKDIKGIDGQGNLLGDNETALGKVDLIPEGTIIERIKEEVPDAAPRLDALDAAKQQAEEQAEEQTKLPDISTLEGKKINKAGNVVDDNGNPIGKVKSGDIKKMIGKAPDKNGKVWDTQGNVIGEVEVLPEAVQNVAAPFEDFPDATVDKFGKVIYDGRQVGVVSGDDFQKLIGKKVDADGDIIDKNGNVIGHAERAEAEEPEEPEQEEVDYSMLRDKKINKLGNVVDDKGQIWGHVVQGVLKNLVGKKVGDKGEIFNDAGQVIGKAEPLPDSERAEVKEPAPFEDFPDAIVGDQGKVMSGDEQIGILVEGDPKKLKGKSVDADGDILDKAGNQLGRAERWEEEEPEPEPEIDMSALAGKRINKAGNAVDSHGDIYGRVVEGDLKRLIGKMCDKNGFIRNEGGDIIGKCELIPEAEREGMKEGPFTELPGCTVNKEGKVVTPGGDVVGRLVSGDPKILFGRAVDDDGDICDKNGNVLGHAERWEEEPEPKDINPMSGRKVNREGNVVDENGDLMGKLTSGILSECAGKKIDDDGDVVDGKGSVLGHCSLLEEIPQTPEPEESEEEKEARRQLEQDKKIAGQISFCIEQSLDKIKPICKMITDRIDSEERKPEDERDEEELVKQVRPLIEEGGKILTEANGVIRGLDPDGRISANAKHKTAAREATPEEYRLADLLKELTGTVTETIENAKRKLENLPHAKKGINPLWGLLSEPLFQIVAAVGLLLSGVLGLVGKLLNGLGLGGLVNNLLGGLGLTKVLDGLGLGQILSPITGQKKK